MQEIPSDVTIVDMNFSRWKKLRACPQQYYATYINPIPFEDELPEDTNRSWLGVAIQKIFELAVEGRWLDKYMADDSIAKDFREANPDLDILSPEGNSIFRSFCCEFILRDIAEDLKLLKKTHLRELPDSYDYKTLSLPPIDSRLELPVVGAKLITKIPACYLTTSAKYNIYVCQNIAIKFVREQVNRSLKTFFDMEEPNLSLRSEVRYKDKIVWLKGVEGYDDLAIRLKGTVDFVLFFGGEYRAPNSVEGAIPFKIIDGKKSDSSYVDEDQLDLYSMLAATGDDRVEHGIPNSNFYIWDEARPWYTDKKAKREYQSNPDTRLALVKTMINHIRPTLNNDKGTHSNPDKFLCTPSYGACMFCVKNENCLGNGTNKEDITEI